MNKKGIENIEDLGMFLLVATILSGVIFTGLWIFYSVGADVRLEEAKTISDKLADGIIENGFLKSEILTAEYSAEDLMMDSGLSSEILNSGGNFYFNVSFYEDKNFVKEFTIGKRIFQVECFLPGEKLPKCFSRNFFALSDGKKYEIKILTGSNQIGGKL